MVLIKLDMHVTLILKKPSGLKIKQKAELTKVNPSAARLYLTLKNYALLSPRDS